MNLKTLLHQKESLASSNSMPVQIASVEAAPVSELTVARQRHFSWWISGTLLTVVLAWISYSLYANPNVDHHTIGKYIFSHAILSGLRTTIILAIVAQAIGILLGIILAVMRLSSNPVGRFIAGAYIWLFRGTPLLVQILFWGNLALFYRNITIGVPGFVLASYATKNVITAFVASLLALSLNEAAYMAEIIRAGILSVPLGQTDAAMALGLSRLQTFRKVVLPQAMPVIIPPSGNQFINMVKMTSLVSVIAGGDLLTEAQNIAAANLRTIELLFVASLWYLAVTTLATLGQSRIERILGRSKRGVGQAGSPIRGARVLGALIDDHA